MAETQAEREALIHTTEKALGVAWGVLQRFSCGRPPDELQAQWLADASQAVLNLLSIRHILEAAANQEKAAAAMKDACDKIRAAGLFGMCDHQDPPKH